MNTSIRVRVNIDFSLSDARYTMRIVNESRTNDKQRAAERERERERNSSNKRELGQVCKYSSIGAKSVYTLRQQTMTISPLPVLLSFTTLPASHPPPLTHRAPPCAVNSNLFRRVFYKFSVPNNELH
jgi:hypothetical protein